MQKAAEDLKKQQELEAEEKRKIIGQRVPMLAIDGMDDGKTQTNIYRCDSSMAW